MSQEKDESYSITEWKLKILGNNFVEIVHTPCNSEVFYSTVGCIKCGKLAHEIILTQASLLDDIWTDNF